MSDYRIYFLDGEGHIVERLELDCADDSEAVRAVADHADGRAMELWDRARLVRRFPASGSEN